MQEVLAAGKPLHFLAVRAQHRRRCWCRGGSRTLSTIREHNCRGLCKSSTPGQKGCCPCRCLRLAVSGQRSVCDASVKLPGVPASPALL